MYIYTLADELSSFNIKYKKNNKNAHTLFNIIFYRLLLLFYLFKIDKNLFYVFILMATLIIS